MKLLVVGISPLPFVLYQVLKSKYLLDVHSLKNDLVFLLAKRSYDGLLIWANALPHLTAKKIVSHLMKRFPSLPILVFGGIYSSVERAEVLKVGAKDCVPHTVSQAELLAKIALLSPEPEMALANQPFTQGKFAFDFQQNLAFYRHVIVPLNRKEALLLGALLRRKNTIVSQQMLYDLIWDSADLPLSNSLEVYISSLRRKIEKPFGLKLIETVKGVGYRIKNYPILGDQDKP